MIEMIANTMLALGLFLLFGKVFLNFVTDLAHKSVVRIETRNLDGDIQRMLDT